MKRVILTFVLAGCAGGAEDRSTLEAIPKAAAATVRQQAGGVTIQKVDKETENGTDVYEAVWFVGGVRHEAKVTGAGVLLELEVELADSEVPAVVKATAEKQLGRGAKYVRLTLTGNYEAEVVAKGGEKEVVIAPDGKVVGRDGDGGDQGDGDGEESDD